MVREDITKLNRAVLCALITIKVHARDNISALVASQVVERCDWFHTSYLFKYIVASKCVKFSVLCFTMGNKNKFWMAETTSLLLGRRHRQLSCQNVNISPCLWLWVSGSIAASSNHSINGPMLLVPDGGTPIRSWFVPIWHSSEKSIQQIFWK